MHNLQKLFDFYRDTKPTKGKLNDAANFLIHTCKALRVTMPEDIDPELLEDIPTAIEEYFGPSRDKAIQDKSTFAEMIGRYGPKNGWEKPFQKLLNDSDSNLRQFALHALEYCGKKTPELIIPYIETVSKSKDLLMRNVAVILVGKLFCAGHNELLKTVIQGWQKQGNRIFIQEIYLYIRTNSRPDMPEDARIQFKNWLQLEFNLK